ncbi:MAG: hypothetical protein EBZ47_07830 [Chlamydiae bacterium]|nr:hypothetical protein [Chlamydiota bacterium]
MKQKTSVFGQFAVAQQRLEGLEPSCAVVSDLERAARGEVTTSEVIANINQRFMNEYKIL